MVPTIGQGTFDELITLAPTLAQYKERHDKWPVACGDDEDCPDSEASGDNSWESTIVPTSSSTTSELDNFFIFSSCFPFLI